MFKKLFQRNQIQVSILCQSYNQKRYIVQALDSFLNQKTTFKFEVIINDDASNDGTAEIIKEYQKNYPDIIKPIFQVENLYSKGIRGFVAKFLIPKSSGKYLIVCDADDYFIDDNKLQAQFDYLEKNPRYTICFHPVKVIFENKQFAEFIFPETDQDSYFILENLIHDNFIQTNSAMYRKIDYQYITSANMIPNDWYLHLYHAKHGKIGFINKVMAIYRKHPDGIWWELLDNSDSFFLKNGILNLRMFFELIKLFNDNLEYKEIIYAKISSLLLRVSNVLNKDQNLIFKEDLNFYEKEISEYLSYHLAK